MSRSDLYGLWDADLDQAAARVAAALDVAFSSHDSSFRAGRHQRHESPGEELVLQPNYDRRLAEWSEDEFTQAPFLLYVTSTRREQRARALLAVSGVRLLRWGDGRASATATGG